MGVGCPLRGWSPVTSAMANTTLAGIMAGFMLNGIVLLLSSDSSRRRAGYVQAASLLFAAFVTLGLDSYLFGLVTGDNTALTGKFSTCGRAWTEAMFATGLLAIGAVAIIVSFVFLFAIFFRDMRVTASSQHYVTNSLSMLESMCHFLRLGVGAVALGLIWMTTRGYVFAMFRSNAPSWTSYVLYGSMGLGFATSLIFLMASLKSRSFDNPISRILKANNAQQYLRALQVAIYSSLAYSLLSVIWASIVASTPVHFWNPTHFWVKVIIAATIFWVLLVSLIPLAALMVRLVPSFSPEDVSDGEAGP
jgi:hypothetical protein